MRGRVQAGRVAASSLLAMLALVGCNSPGGSPPPSTGILTLTFTPANPSVAPLALTSASLKLEQLTLLGDVTPDGRAMLAELSLDVLSTGESFMFDMLPQGLYSGVQFDIDGFAAQGTWRGVPLQVQLEGPDNGSTVDLRSPTGAELGPAQNAALDVQVDASSWFANQILDSATGSSSQIVISSDVNGGVAQQIFSRLLSSFALRAQPIQ